MARICHRKQLTGFLIGWGCTLAALLATNVAMAQAPAGGISRHAAYDDAASIERHSLVRQAQHAGVYDRSSTRVAQAGYVPRHQRISQGRLISQEEIPAPAEGAPYDMQYEGEYFEGEVYPGEYGGGCDSCGGGCGSCCGHGCGVQTRCMPVCCLPVPCFSMENFTASLGVVGFKGPLNHGYDGSFGFSYGFNWGGPALFGSKYGLGMQVGAQIIQSDLSGSSFTVDERDQVFFTAGLFRRVDCGLQAGLVWDYMYQEWGDELEAAQIRGEASWVSPCGYDIGFTFTASTKDDEWVTDQNVNGNMSTAPFSTAYDVETTDYYAGFYRKQFADCNGGEGRFLAGFTQFGDGFVGADMTVPINNSWALQGSFTYLIPDGDRNAEDRHDDESWNVGIRLVWYPRCNARNTGCGGYYRPLMNVADNGSMLFDTLGRD